jgi:hypothetical protein
MKGVIVTTTINSPTEAIQKYDAMEDWTLIVVGDRKTPEYELQRGRFVSWNEQRKQYPDLCKLIGPDSVRRGRMIAFIEGYRTGLPIIASIDDDCHPYPEWGQNVVLGKRMKAQKWEPLDKYFDPFTAANYSIPARGFPDRFKRISKSVGDGWITPFVQEDLCDGQSDIEARFRARGYYSAKFNTTRPFFAEAFSPINTQNTFIHRSVLCDFFANIPGIGRADDIWAGYFFQAKHPNSTLYGPASCDHQQSRTIGSILHDHNEETYMIDKTGIFLASLEADGIEETMKKFLPKIAINAIKAYRGYFL